VVAVMSSFGGGQKLHNNLELNIWELDSGISSSNPRLPQWLIDFTGF
jgi:hypothetical protein